jgi:hypothetical protein
MTREQLAATRVLLNALKKECAANPIATLNESHLKVVGALGLLRAGYSILEASTKNCCKALKLTEERLTIESRPKLVMAAGVGAAESRNSADLRVIEPIRVVIELQARSAAGSQDALFSKNIVDDLNRVREGRADVFIFVCDWSIYQPLRGLRTDKRGRRATDARLMASVFPVREQVPWNCPDPLTSICKYDGLATGAVRTLYHGEDRILSATWRIRKRA